MGCDIHSYSETKIDNLWVADRATDFTVVNQDGYRNVTMATLYKSRNYGLFGLLAGVRQEIDNSFQPRGMPDDASYEVSAIAESWREDAHTHSHLLLSELQAKAAEYLINPGKIQDYVYAALVGLIESFPHKNDPENQRMVFWFDN